MQCKVHTPEAGPIDFWDASQECDDCKQLLDAVDNAIATARRIGVPRYGPSSWRNIPASEHLLHASNHIADSFKDNNEDHLSHAICRLAMAKAINDAQRN